MVYWYAVCILQTLRESGDLQVWRNDNGQLISTFSVGAQVWLAFYFWASSNWQDVIILFTLCYITLFHRWVNAGFKCKYSRFPPTHPCLTTPLRGNPSKFLDETYPVKSRGMGLLYGKNGMVLTSTVFDWSTRVMDRQTDRQTDLR